MIDSKLQKLEFSTFAASEKFGRSWAQLAGYKTWHSGFRSGQEIMEHANELLNNSLHF
jgi:hypothetical protein